MQQQAGRREGVLMFSDYVTKVQVWAAENLAI